MWVMPTIRVGDRVEYDRAVELPEHLLGRAVNLTEPLEEVGVSLVGLVDQQLQTGGAFAGSRWAPLTDAYARFKERHWPGRPILTRTGEMASELRSMQALHHIGLSRIVYAPDSQVAGWHQYGTPRMPARPIVEITDPWRHEVDRIFTRWIMGDRHRIAA